MPTEAKLVSTVIPPPTQGWSTKQPISAMDPMYSPEMENWFPGDGVVSLRKGSTQYSTGVGSSSSSSNLVRSIGDLISTNSGIIAIADNDKKVYSLTLGAASDISGGAAFNSAFCAIHQFRDRIFIKEQASTTNDVYHWTGTGNIAASAFTGPSGDDKDLWVIGSYKSRLYFGQQTAPSIWYGGVDAVTGALTEFSLLSILRQGGPRSIAFVGSATQSKEGQGDELFCVISLYGEVLFYQGDNPGHSTWSLVGRYQIPSPIPRGFFYMGGSLCVITQAGLYRLNDLLRGFQGIVAPTLSDEIEDRVVDAYAVSYTNAYNTGLYFPEGKFALLNYSPNAITPNAQLILNVQTGAWTKFTGWEAYCWAASSGSLYFGSKCGVVMKANTGTADEDPASAGTYLTQTRKLRHAYNYFGEPRSNKHPTQARPIFLGSRAAGDITIASDCDMDYANTVKTASASFPSSSATETLYQHRVGLTGHGKCASYRIDAVTADTLKLQATEIFYNKGDV